jgi:hypothetical protein
MSYTDYKQRWEFKNGEAYYIPQSKSYAEKLKRGLSISELTKNHLLEGDPSVKELERPSSTQVRLMLPSEDTLDIESPIPRRKEKKDPKLQSVRNRKKPHQRWTRLRFQFPLLEKEEEQEEINYDDWDKLFPNYDYDDDAEEDAEEEDDDEDFEYRPRLGVRLFLVCFPSYLRTSATQ